jgi:hypothetical protein
MSMSWSSLSVPQQATMNTNIGSTGEAAAAFNRECNL